MSRAMHAMRLARGTADRSGKMAPLILAMALLFATTPTESAGSLFAYGLYHLSWGVVIFVPFAYKQLRIDPYLLAAALALVVYTALPNAGDASAGFFVFTWAVVITSTLAATYRDPARAVDLVQALDLIIYLNILALVVQLVGLLFFGRVLDLHSLAFPYSSARITEVGGSLLRLTGLHLEPGTYANWMYGLAIWRALLSGRLFGRPTVIAMASIFVTLSFWGVIAAAAYLLAFLVSVRKSRALVRHGLPLLLALFVAGALFAERLQPVVKYFDARSAFEDDSGAAKLDALRVIWEGLDHYLVIGQRFSYIYCDWCISPQDVGVALNSVIYLGLVVALLVVGFFVLGVRSRLGAPGVVAALPLLLAKYYIIDGIWWALVFCALGFVRQPSRLPQQRLPGVRGSPTSRGMPHCLMKQVDTTASQGGNQ